MNVRETGEEKTEVLMSLNSVVILLLSPTVHPFSLLLLTIKEMGVGGRPEPITLNTFEFHHRATQRQNNIATYTLLSI